MEISECIKACLFFCDSASVHCDSGYFGRKTVFLFPINSITETKYYKRTIFSNRKMARNSFIYSAEKESQKNIFPFPKLNIQSA